MTITTTHTEQIHAIQDQIAEIKFEYRDNTLAFRALHLAWEATRLAWYAVKRNNDGGKLADVEWALGWIKSLFGER